MPILAICIPTYNGGEMLLENIKSILKCEDQRFVVYVNDNCSSDNTVDLLNTINDKRLFVNRNNIVVKAYNNYDIVLQNADAEYIYLLMDKEIVNRDYLHHFIDFLVDQKPNFGYAHYSENISYCKYKSGLDSMRGSGGFGNTHPTGFYYRHELYKSRTDYVKEISGGGNLWYPDLVSECLGVKYEATIYFSPLNKFSYKAVLGLRSKTPYSKESVYFYGGDRCKVFKLFLKVILDNREYLKSSTPTVIFKLICFYMKLVSSVQRQYFHDEQRCSHYGIETRDVSYGEMVDWNKKLVKILREELITNSYKIPQYYGVVFLLFCRLYALAGKFKNMSHLFSIIIKLKTKICKR